MLAWRVADAPGKRTPALRNSLSHLSSPLAQGCLDSRPGWWRKPHIPAASHFPLAALSGITGESRLRAPSASEPAAQPGSPQLSCAIAPLPAAGGAHMGVAVGRRGAQVGDGEGPGAEYHPPQNAAKLLKYNDIPPLSRWSLPNSCWESCRTGGGRVDQERGIQRKRTPSPLIC